MSQEYYNAYRFVASVVSPFVSRDEILFQLTKQTPLDWESVADVAGGHSVIQALYPAFVENELIDLIPDDFLSYVQHLHEINCERNEMMRGQLIDAVLVINKLDIKPLLMKGAAHLFLNTFSTEGDRLLTDLDILVPANDIELISNELIEIGYEYYEDQIHYIESHHHYPPLIKQDECATIELHRELMFREQQHTFPTEYAWENTIDITLPNTAEAKVLTPTYRVFHSFLHGSVVDLLHLSGHVEIRQMHELARSQLKYSSDINWQELLMYADEHRIGRKLAANLYAASKFMSFPIEDTGSNNYQVSSACHFARVYAKLKYNWFNFIDITTPIVRLRRSIRRIPFYLAKYRRKRMQRES